jgi:hypothetical protein
MPLPKTLVSLFSFLLAVQVIAAGHDVSTSPATTPQLLPVLAANDRDFIAAWTEPAPPKNAVVAGRIDHNGLPMDNAGIAVSASSFVHPAIARGSSETLVVWNNSGIFAARITPSGALLDSTPIAIANTGYGAPVAVTWDGSRYFVIWTDDRQQLTGAFVSANGNVTTPKVFMTPVPSDYVFEPDVAWDGHEYIVTYATGFNTSLICSACRPFPDTVYVMGVSAAGAAIDAVPIRVAGKHLHAHVASSGAGILIALDGEHDVSTLQVAEDNGLLRLGEETPLFHWFGSVSSDVVWDGAAYTIAYRYFGRPDGPSWVGTQRIGDSGTWFEKRWVAAETVGAASFADWGGPSLAANLLGESAFVISEIAPGSSVPRARLYFGHETHLWHGLPEPPHDAVSHFNGHTATITWQSGGNPFGAGLAQGYLIEVSDDSGKTWTTAYVTMPDELSWTTQASVGEEFRISALTGGGTSFPGAATTIHSEPRRHAVR